MRFARSIVWVLAVLSSSASALASSGGYVGVSTTGCGGCHGSQSIATSVVIEGPTMVVRGSVNTFTLVVNNINSTQIGLGFNVGSTNGALMMSASAPQTQLLAGELTQTTSIPRPISGPWRVAFTWTAPAAVGAARINAAANAVDINGGSGSTDQWNLGSLSVSVIDAMPTDSGVPMDSGISTDSGVAPDSGAPMDASVRDATTDASDASDANNDTSDASDATDATAADRVTNDASDVVGDGSRGADDASSDATDATATADVITDVITDAPSADDVAPNDGGARVTDAASDGGTSTTAPGCRCGATPTALDPRGASLLLFALAPLARRRRRS